MTQTQQQRKLRTIEKNDNVMASWKSWKNRNIWKSLQSYECLYMVDIVSS